MPQNHRKTYHFNVTQRVDNCNYCYYIICLDQETANEPLGLRVNLPPAQLSTACSDGFTLSHVIAKHQTGKL